MGSPCAHTDPCAGVTLAPSCSPLGQPLPLAWVCAAFGGLAALGKAPEGGGSLNSHPRYAVDEVRLSTTEASNEVFSCVFFFFSLEKGSNKFFRGCSHPQPGTGLATLVHIQLLDPVAPAGPWGWEGPLPGVSCHPRWVTGWRSQGRDGCSSLRRACGSEVRRGQGQR